MPLRRATRDTEVRAAGSQEVPGMSHRWFRHPLLWSPVLALCAQLALAAATLACTGGADFPFYRR